MCWLLMLTGAICGKMLDLKRKMGIKTLEAVGINKRSLLKREGKKQVGN